MLKKSKIILFFSLLFFSFVSLARYGDEKALVIIDMQNYFVKRGGGESKLGNRKKLKALINAQIGAIKEAKKSNIPIIVIKYKHKVIRGSGKKINSKLKKAIGYYKKVKIIQKTTDGMFSSGNRYLAKLDKYLRKEKIGELIIMGANGSACVSKSIKGAFTYNYSIAAYSKGIADFNYVNYIYPYNDRYKFKPKCASCTFREVDTLSEVIFIMTKTAHRHKKNSRVNNTSRNSEIRKKIPLQERKESGKKENSVMAQ